MNIQILRKNVKTFILIFFLTPSALLGADLYTPFSLGLAGAARAAPLFTDSIYLNPAHMSFTAFKSFSASYQKSQGTEQNSTPWAVSVVDGSTDALCQAGLGFMRLKNADALHIALSKTLFPRFALGIGSKIFFVTAPFERLIDFYASITTAPQKWLFLSLTLDNINQKIKIMNPHRELTLGSKFFLGEHLTFTFDSQIEVQRKIHSLGYAMAAEIKTFSDVLFRAGFFSQLFQPSIQQKASGTAFGLGWVAPKLALFFAASTTLQPVHSKNYGMQLSVFF
jgi:hypothetical protein